MAEKRKLLAEVDKCFKKIDEGVDLFREIMQKVLEANSDNQRDKYQDDLKKEIKKLQRLRDQVKGWQAGTDIKDKQKLNDYRRTIESRMEEFKDIERESKTKLYSKVGLCAEEKVDPKEKEKSDTIDWLQHQLRAFNDESDRTEMQIESLSSADGGKKRGKKEKEDRAMKLDELESRLERLVFHIDKLEIIMRLVNNESLDAGMVMDVLKDDMETYTEALAPDYDGDEEDFATLDPRHCYDELHLFSLLGTMALGTVDDEKENNHDGYQQECEEPRGSRHGSSEAVVHVSSPLAKKAAPHVGMSAIVSPARLRKESTTESPAVAISSPSVSPPCVAYNNVVARRPHPPPPPPPPASTRKATFPTPSVARQPVPQPASPAISSITVKPEEPPKPEPEPPTPEVQEPPIVEPEPPVVKPAPAVITGRPADVLPQLMAHLELKETPLSELNLDNVFQMGTIPSWLGVSPLGKVPQCADYESTLAAIDIAYENCIQPYEKSVLPFESQRPRTYLPKLDTAIPHYPKAPLSNSDTLEYYLRLSPEALFFAFYYMEGTRAQLLAAKALKKLSWRFHTKFLTWFQRLEEPTIITDHFEQGTYLYFDFERWGQRKKEGFAFEYRFLEDKDLDEFGP